MTFQTHCVDERVSGRIVMSKDIILLFESSPNFF